MPPLPSRVKTTLVPRSYFQSTGVACFAHRGGAAQRPENTLEAFRSGFEAGCAWIETDVHMTTDGHIVCFHDSTLERTTDGRGPIAEHSLAQLRRLDAGYRFGASQGHPYRGQGIRIPTLEEALDLDPALRFNLEIKSSAPAAVFALWRFIEDRKIHDRVLVASAADWAVRAFRDLERGRGRVASSAGTREIAAFVAAVRLGVSAHLPLEYEALQVPLHHKFIRVVDRSFVRAAHERGLQVHVWTIDDPGEIRTLLDLGVDGIMTDHPARLVGLVSERGLMPEHGDGGGPTPG